MKILVIEDEPSIVELLRFNLKRSGYDVETASDGGEGIKLALGAGADLIVLDIMLPVTDGFEVCRKIRSAGVAAPVIMLTARDGERDKIMALDSGADDYVTKPFAVGELLARIRANLRRSAPVPAENSKPEELNFGNLRVNDAVMDAEKNGERLGLTRREYDLLKYLAVNRGRVFSRDELMRAVWDYEYGDARAVDVTVRRLREKIEDDPAAPAHVVTRRGAGYYFA